MDNPPLLLLGTRGSPLALAQARMTAAALEAAHGWAPGTVALNVIKTSGDRIQDRALAEVGGKALWTKELDRALIDGETHASVHSMKDVESERPDALVIAAMLPRADVRDRLIGVEEIDALPHGALVGTSSPRRAAQLRRLRPDLRIGLLRGNVDTRLAKVASGDFAASLLAAAGLDRLGKTVGVAVATDVMLPAPAQGAVGIECRADDAATRARLAAIDHRETHAAVAVERAFTRALGGTCHSPVAALALVAEEGFEFRAAIYSEDGADMVEERALLRDAGEAEALAGAMLARAPDSIRRLFEA
ncbi:hydroxymethylbilane synthase [Sphingomonas sp. ASV193]|uniref:hydroxymethylbilane synthase n=1 Tax=Sphingomonas sp. ASV193 TaxID=3144405 RepID=UPI0032E8A83F